jgi:hypothetical protein
VIDLTAVLYAQRSKPRGDELEAHVADLYGCDRAAWFRRNGFAPLPFTPDRQARFAIGHAYEAQVAKDLRGGGIEVLTDSKVEYLGLTGHPDAVCVNIGLVLDCKTTDARKPDDTVKPHYAIQVSAYTLARARLEEAKVLVKYAGSHLEKVYDVDPEAWRPRIEERAAEIHARTAPGSPMPEAVGYPGDLVSWTCPQYCQWPQCEKHPDHEEPMP